MTIHFSVFSEFEDALRRVNPGVNAQELLSAVDCVKITQKEDSLTFLQTVEPERAGFERTIHHDLSGGEGGGGLAGVSYLVYIPELLAKLSRLGKSSTRSLTLQYSERGLKLRKNLRIENGQEIHEGVLLARLYSGASGDFHPIEAVSIDNGWVYRSSLDAPVEEDEEEDELETRDVFTKVIDTDILINKEKFKIWISLLMDFGEFGTERRPEGTALSRSISITLDKNARNINGMSNCKGAHMAYLQVNQPFELVGETHDELAEDDIEDDQEEVEDNKLVFAIEGRHLKKLEALAKTEENIRFITGVESADIETRWLTVSGDLGRTTLKAGEPLRTFLLDAMLFKDIETIRVGVREFKLTPHSKRTVALSDLQAAVSMQQPSKSERLTGASLILVESDSTLVIAQATDLAGQERSNVFWDLITREGDWEPLSVNGDALEAGLDIFKKYFTAIRSPSSVIELVQKKFIQADGTTSWNLYIQTPSDQTAKVLIFAHNLNSVADFIDSRD